MGPDFQRPHDHRGGHRPADPPLRHPRTHRTELPGRGGEGQDAKRSGTHNGLIPPRPPLRRPLLGRGFPDGQRGSAPLPTGNPPPSASRLENAPRFPQGPAPKPSAACTKIVVVDITSLKSVRASASPRPHRWGKVIVVGVVVATRRQLHGHPRSTGPPPGNW